MEREPDDDVHSLIRVLQEKPHPSGHTFVPTEYAEVAAQVTSAIKELKQRNQIFEGAPSADVYIEPSSEREVEVVPVRTEDELVAEVLRERAIEKGDVVEVEDDKSEGEDEPVMTTKEILLSAGQLQRALLSRGELCICTAEMLALVQGEIV
jgi:hypothetical protein